VHDTASVVLGAAVGSALGETDGMPPVGLAVVGRCVGAWVGEVVGMAENVGAGVVGRVGLAVE
jgi:hypothetical protein